jgi:hypothetical protein
MFDKDILRITHMAAKYLNTCKSPQDTSVALLSPEDFGAFSKSYEDFCSPQI